VVRKLAWTVSAHTARPKIPPQANTLSCANHPLIPSLERRGKGVAWLLWLSLALVVAAAAEPVGMRAYDFRYLPQLRTGSMHLASSADPNGGNDDRGHFLRRDGVEAVLLETHQPGMICRIWSANPHGRLKIYLDGEAAARISLPFARLAEAGPETPTVPGFVSSAGGGVSCWYPIPFAKSCKVTVEGAQQLYYQVNYWTYPPSTKVTTFTTGPAEEIGGGDWGNEHAATVTIPPGEGRTLLQRSGPETIRRLILQPKPASFAALRTLRIQMTWDGAARPSVDAPLLDFWAAGLGAGQYLSAPMSIAGWDFFQSDWPLPYAKSATIKVINDGQKPVTIAAAAYATAGRREDDGYLHAAYHSAVTVAGKPHLVAEVTGRGQYVGTAVTLLGKPDLTYLEGDETIVVDGTETLQGTGTEDFFDGAWFFKNGEYAEPFAGSPALTGGKSAIAAYRWQVADCVPFRKSLKVTLEHGPGNDQPGLPYRSVGYWYGDQPRAVPASSIPTAPPAWTASEPGAVIVEGEALEGKLTLVGATAKMTDDSGANMPASGGKQVAIQLTDPKQAEIGWPLSVPKAGIYDLQLRLVSGGPDFSWTATLDGEPVTPSLQQATVGETIWRLGRAYITAGEHKLSISAAPFDKAGGFGVDFVRLAEVGAVKGAVEAESLKTESSGQDSEAVIQTSAGTPENAILSLDVIGGAVSQDTVWSGGGQVRFAPAQADATMTVTLPIDSDGDYGLAVGYMRGPDYGLCEISLDGLVLGTIDGHADVAQVGARAGLGTHHLAAGDHELRFEPLSGQDRVRAVGLDYFLVEPATRGHEAENLVRSITGPAARAQIKERFGAEPRWSGGAYISFPTATADEPVVLTLFAPRSGKYRVELTPALIPGGGKVKLSLGGAEAEYDCGAAGETLGKPVGFEAALRKGGNELRLWSFETGDAIALDAIALERIGGGGLPIGPLVLIILVVLIVVLIKRKGRQA